MKEKIGILQGKEVFFKHLVNYTSTEQKKTTITIPAEKRILHP